MKRAASRDAQQTVMNLDHDIAQQWLLRQRDGALTADQQRALELHLSGCEQCRAEAQELEAWQTTLDRGLRARYAGVVSAETMRKQQQLKQQLTQPRRPARQLPALATGLVALIAIIAVVLRVPQLSELQATAAVPTSAIVQVDDATVTATATVQATSTRDAQPTDAPPPTMTSVPTAVRTIAESEPTGPISTEAVAIVEAAVPTATAVPPTAAPTIRPPTATAMPLPTQTAVPTAVVIIPTATAQPTETPIPATATPVPSPTATATPTVTATPTATATTEVADLDPVTIAQRFADTFNQGSAADVRETFAEQVIYAARGVGYQYVSNEQLVAEVQQFQQLNSQFALVDCIYPLNLPEAGQVNCTLFIQNDWRRALGFEAYEGITFLHFDLETQRITQFIAFQFTNQAEMEQQAIVRLINWYNANHDGADLVYLQDASNRIVYSAELFASVPTWVSLGRP